MLEFISRTQREHLRLSQNNWGLRQESVEKDATIDKLKGEWFTLRTFEADFQSLQIEKNNLKTKLDSWGKQIEDLEKKWVEANKAIENTNTTINGLHIETTSLKYSKEHAVSDKVNAYAQQCIEKWRPENTR